MDIEELRGIELFTGLTDDQLAELADRWRRGALRDRRRAVHRGRARRRVVGAARRGRSTWSARSAARTSWSPGWTCRAAGPAASARGTTTASTSPPAAARRRAGCCGSMRPRLRELVNHWFPLAGHLIGGLHHTARSIESTVRQRDALVTLGTLAAGLAHEINNPAAAASRTVDDLGQSLRRAARGADPARPRRHHRRPVQRARRAAPRVRPRRARSTRWRSPTARATGRLAATDTA